MADREREPTRRARDAARARRTVRDLAAAFALVAVALLGCGAPRYRPSEPLPHTSSFDERATRAMLATLTEEVDAQEVPTLLAHVETRDGRSFTAAVGTRDLRRHRDASLDDCVRVGSVTKVLVAVVAVRLAAEGVLSLDDPVARWLPGLPAGDRVTLMHLLSHRGGVPDILDDFGAVMGATIFTERVTSQDELLRRLVDLPRRHEPGERFEYSNGHTIVLGAILERATGRELHDLLRAYVLAPSGATRTRLLPDGPAPSCLLTGYDRDLVPFGHDVSPTDTSFASLAWASGGLCSTAADLAAIVRGIRDATLVSPEGRAAMLPRWPAHGDYGETAVGAGLFRFERSGRSYIGHAGLFIGAQALAVWDEVDGTILVVAGNRSSFDVVRVVSRLGQHARAETR